MVAGFWTKVCLLCYYKSLLSLAELKQWFGGTRLEMPSPVHRRSQDFGLGVGQTKNLMQWSHQKFSKEEFLWVKDIVEWKIRSRGLVWHLTESFLKREGLNQKLQMKISNWETCVSKLVYSNVSQTGIWGRSPSRWAIFRNFFEKKAILMLLDHVSNVFRTIERSRLSTFESQLKKIKLF